MVFFAFVGVGISAWAVWLLKKTLDATIVAVREGEKATAASLISIETATESNAIMRQDQRPWLKLDVGIVGSVTFDGKTVQVSVDWRVTNVGRSPADTLNVHIVGAPFKLTPEARQSARSFATDCH